ncbi:enoyl-CoA hydratase/isomerase family protein [Pseudonocardia kunmingensis]|uniref:Enoyl-CoA hydratase/carnithine racemase n=1 Tax=Pseudonocardia kunmingensis TaxID=630975 RepID=A0A543DVL9_9PSEU|nr:enoyl-CoA hydratase/isomerase family protein [Pseudonocardia kunmingensis]TQM13364.1 enoyl-CoA hydratase/carnithine racemase [Pseudonocardia kunmingensis]
MAGPVTGAEGTPATTPSVDVSSHGPVAVVRVSNPPLNLLTSQLRGDLHRIADAIRDDRSVRAVVLTGAGERAFSVGSDIREFPVDAAAGRRRAQHEHACYDAIAGLPQPVVAALTGHVLGGGLELALACDLRVADAGARLGLPEVKLGVFPSGGGTSRLPRLIAPSQAKRLMLLGETVDAERAAALGLVDEVAPAGTAEDVALQLAGRIAQLPAMAVQAIKRAVDHGLAHGARAGQELEAELIAGLFGTADAQEGVRAFLDSRPPRFAHR